MFPLGSVVQLRRIWRALCNISLLLPSSIYISQSCAKVRINTDHQVPIRQREPVISSTTMILHLIYDSFDFKSWIVLFFVFLLLVDMIKNRNPSNFPPGPWPLPFLGTVFTKMDFRTMNEVGAKFMFFICMSDSLVSSVSAFRDGCIYCPVSGLRKYCNY